MSPWLAIPSGAIALAIVLWWWGKRPAYHRRIALDQLPRFIASFLKQMDDGAVMMIDRDAGPGFLQFALIQARGDTQRVEFGFPCVAWSAAQFDALERALRAAGFAPSREPGPGDGTVEAFLRVAMWGSFEQLVQRMLLMVRLSVETLGWTLATFTIHYRGWLRPGGRRAKVPL
jgi:hypothetical protein